MTHTTPYPGLRPYQETEQATFYGRDADTAALLDKIPANRLSLLFAATGVGKSSLLQAAILPRLRAKDGAGLDVVYYNDWVAPPASGLQHAVRQALQQRYPMLPATADNLSLPDFFHTIAPHTSQPLVVVLDQFEEFFRYRFVHHRDSFQPFIDQLADVILDTHLPIALVFSMREDFALELNAFKPHLPNPLFGNYYRLEKLTEAGARDAITTPLSAIGYQYEPELLQQLLHDLLSRDLSRDAASLVQGVSADSVEPPYLQIVCSQLWELDQHDPQQTLRLATYRKAGGAKGLLENYVNYVLKRFSDREKQVASKAFDHLISRRGTKMAHTPDDLASLVNLKPSELAKVLDKLENARILRRQQRDQTVWYELYHDMFSGGIESWNTGWKNHLRLRRTVLATSASLLILAGIGFSVVAYLQASSKHLRLGTANSDKVEVYTGSSKFPDPFGQQRYVYETTLTRNQLELDKRYPKRDVQDYANLGKELVSSQPADARFSGYINNGEYCQVSTLLGQVLPDAKSAPGCSDKRETLDRQSHPIATKASIPATAAPSVDDYDPLRDAVIGSIRQLRTQWGFDMLQAAGNQLTSEMVTFPLDLPLPFDPDAWLEQMQQVGFNGGTPGIFDDPRKLATLLTALIDTPAPAANVAPTGNSIAMTLRDYVGSNSQHLGVLQAVMQHLNLKPKLEALLTHADLDQVEAATVLLAQLQSPSAVEGLHRLWEKDRQVSITALDYVLEDPRIPPALSAILQDRQRSQEMRSYAADALSQTDGFDVETVTPLLLKYFNDTTEWETVRKAAASSLGKIGDTRAAPDLLRIFSNPKERLDVRFGALDALTLMAWQEATPTLLTHFNDPQEPLNLRIALATSLGFIGKPEQTVPALLAVLQAPETPYDLVNALNTTLAMLGDNRAVPALLEQRNKLQASMIDYFDKDILAYFNDTQVQQLLQTQASKPLKNLKDQLINNILPLSVTFKAENPNLRPDFWHELSNGYYGSVQYGINIENLPLCGTHAQKKTFLKASNDTVIPPTTEQINQGFNQVLTPEGTTALIQLALDETAHFTLRISAMNTLLMKSAGTLSSASAIIAQLQPLSSHANPLLRKMALKTKIRLQSGTALLAEVRNADTPIELRHEALISFAITAPRAEAVTALLELAKDESSPLYPAVLMHLGQLHAREALPLLETALDTLALEYRAWRKQRDQRPTDDTNPETFSQWQQAVKQATPKHAYLAAHYGYALASIDHDKGIAALAHDLADVRDGAVIAFTEIADPALLQTLDTAREQRKNTDPMFRQSAFLAIDQALTRLEITTDATAIQQLKHWQAAIQSRPADDSVKQRLQWTLTMINHYQTLAQAFHTQYGVSP